LDYPFVRKELNYLMFEVDVVVVDYYMDGVYKEDYVLVG
jgi:hypothetical protein